MPLRRARRHARHQRELSRLQRRRLCVEVLIDEFGFVPFDRTLRTKERSSTDWPTARPPGEGSSWLAQFHADRWITFRAAEARVGGQRDTPSQHDELCCAKKGATRHDDRLGVRTRSTRGRSSLQARMLSATD
jgi:hypothetical protein